jgi:hypothetical protein
MRLLRLQDVEISPKELVFRHARLRAFIVWLAGFAATAALFFKAFTHKILYSAIRYPNSVFRTSFPHCGLILLLQKNPRSESMGDKQNRHNQSRSAKPQAEPA